MQIIPLKEKYRLTEDDVNNLGTWIVDGYSLEEMAHHLDGKMNVEQIYIAAGIIAREMFDMPLQDLNPDLVKERKLLSQELHDEWEEKRISRHLMSLLRGLAEDLTLYEMELQIAANKSS